VIDIELLWATQLRPNDHAEMASLFDGEYAPEWGPWNPKGGYGYAGSELHSLARMDGRLVGHAASARQFVGVGDGEVVIAGVGGVITRREARGKGIGRAVLAALQEAIGSFAPADFGLA
jgi:aminoglycoside 2'-N-acetyltransferase I